MPITISASVGKGGTNNSKDVTKVQEALNSFPFHWGGPVPQLEVDGDCGPVTKAAIGGLQWFQFGWMDNKISPGGVTLSRINEMLASPEKPGSPTKVKIRYNMSYPGIAQVKHMACWAATGAMLLTAKKNKAYTIEEGLEVADKGPSGTYHLLWEWNSGLKWDYYEDYVKKMGLQGEGRKTIALGAIKGWLERGPIGLTLDVKGIIHVVAAYGLRGDGTEFGTQVAGFDPFGYEFKIGWYTMRGLYQNIDMPVIWHI
jgi:hypothetical protein